MQNDLTLFRIGIFEAAYGWGGGTGTRYKLEILHQCGERVKNKTQKVWEVNSYVCRSYREKTGRGAFLAPSPS